MKKLISSITLLAFVSFMTACAPAAHNIKPHYTSPAQYSSYDCSQIQVEMTRVETKLRTVSAKQNSLATKDALAMSVGLILFAPALIFLIGGNDKEEVASLKGQCEALTEIGIQNHCGLIMADTKTLPTQAMGNDVSMSLDESEDYH